LARAPTRPARRRAPDLGGRIPGSAQLLDRLRARGPSPGAHGGAPARWGSVVLPGRRAAPRRHARAPRSDRRLLRVGGRHGWAAPPRRRRLRDRAPDGHAAAPGSIGREDWRTAHLLVAIVGGHHLPGGAGTTPLRTERPGGRPHADTEAPARMEWLRAPGRRRHPAEVAWAPSTMPPAFICGPTPLVESVAGALVLLGYAAKSVKTERFGPTGG
jgi:hypothetical protein